MRRQGNTTTRLLVLTVTLGIPRATLAQDRESDGMFEQGRALRAQHHDAEALEVFQRMYARDRSSRALAQVALAEGALGRWVAAEGHLQEALASPDAWVTAQTEPLAAARARIASHLGDLWIDCATPGAELWIDGLRVASLPLTRAVRAVTGTASVEVRAEGHQPVSRTVSVPAEGVVRETFTLAPIPTVAPAPTPVVSAPPSPLPWRQAPPSPPPVHGVPDDTSARRVWAWVSTAGAGALLLTSGALYLAGRGRVDAFNNDVACLGEGAQSQPQHCADHLNSAYSLRDGAIGTLVGGGVIAALAGTLFVTLPRRSGAFACAPGALSAACALRF